MFDFTSNDKNLYYCECNQPANEYDGEDMVQCEFCEQWYHCTCIGTTIEELKEVHMWECTPCLEKRETDEVDQGQKSDSRSLTREKHKIMKEQQIPETDKNTLGV